MNSIELDNGNRDPEGVLFIFSRLGLIVKG